MAELLIGDRPLRIVGMHLDLSGLWRRRQMRAILDSIAARPQSMPTVLMGDVVEPRREFIQENALSVANLDV
jgi:endonuclease/exonuclease/phosphatase family metal-dependent hydrolase